MRPLDPRHQKTIAIIWLAVFGFWLGGLDEKATYDAHYWLMSAVSVTGIASAAYVALQDDWKSKAVLVILLVSSSISIGSEINRVASSRLTRRGGKRPISFRKAPARSAEAHVAVDDSGPS